MVSSFVQPGTREAVRANLYPTVYHTTVPSVASLCVTFGTSVYTPAVAEVAEKFNVSQTVSVLGLSLYVLGLAFGPMIAAPLSETKGRLAVYRFSIPVAAAFTLGAGLSNNMASLAVCRFFAGFFGSPCLAVGAGTIADIWPPVYRAPATSIYLLTPFLGPALGPLVGGFAAESKGWRWTQWPLLIALATSWLYSLPMKETYMKIILQKRSKALDTKKSTPTGPTGLAALKMLLTIVLFRPLYMLFAEPIVSLFSLYVGFNFAVLFGCKSRSASSTPMRKSKEHLEKRLGQRRVQLGSRTAGYETEMRLT